MPASVWKGNVSFGLVSFPVRLTVAARPESVHFHLLHKKDESRVKEVWYCEKENRPVERSELVKGYEYAKGRYVVIPDEDLKKIAPPTASTMEIVQFVTSAEVDPLYFEHSYYVSPEPSGVKPYRLLWKAMTDTGYYAVAKLAMHTREHIVILRPTDDGLVLHTMYFSNELHKANRGKPSDTKYAAKEVELARRLINSLAGPFRPERFSDRYAENVERMIREKRKGRAVTPVNRPKAAPVTGILDALRRSLENKHTAASHRKKSSHRTRRAA